MKNAGLRSRLQARTPRVAAPDPARCGPRSVSWIDHSPHMVAQRRKLQDMVGGDTAPAVQPASGGRGLPEGLRNGLESLSGIDLSDVRVQTVSSQPAQLQAYAFARGNEIHLAPGQERHLPHEAWHLVQQRQGRVAATGRVGGVAVNDDPALEAEADAMGSRALRQASGSQAVQSRVAPASGEAVAQLRTYYAYGAGNVTPHIHCYPGGAHLKVAGGDRYDLAQDGFRVSQDKIDEAFDRVRADYPLATNAVRVALLAEMQRILREFKARPS